MRARSLLSRPGLTLVEVVIAAGVISLIVIFTLSVVPSFKLANRRASLELQAGSLAQSALEQLRTVPFEAVTSTAFPDVTTDGVTYRRAVRESDIITLGTPPQPISKKVRVVVTWSWSDREQQTFRETLLCKLLRR